MDKSFDVVAVDMKTHAVRLIAEDKSEPSAEAIVKIAVMRRGIGKEFFAEVPHGKYKTGDKWKGRLID